MVGTEPALLVLERAIDQHTDLLRAERVEHEHAQAREQRAVDLERGILRRRADEREQPALHVRQQCVLLPAVEAMDLIDEEDRARAEHAALLGVGDDLADARDAVGDGAERHELALHIARDETRDRGLAAARRSPEEDRPRVALLDRDAQRLARAEDLLLPGDLIERARPQPRREGRGERTLEQPGRRFVSSARRASRGHASGRASPARPARCRSRRRRRRCASTPTCPGTRGSGWMRPRKA